MSVETWISYTKTLFSLQRVYKGLGFWLRYLRFCLYILIISHQAQSFSRYIDVFLQDKHNINAMSLHIKSLHIRVN